MTKGLGRAGYMSGSWQDYKLCMEATKEIYRLQGKEWNAEIEKFFENEIKTFNKYNCLNYVRKLNCKIKKLGGNTIGTHQIR